MLPEHDTKPNDQMIVVAIGASAGGLRPLQELFSELPDDTGMAFIVIQHLSPDFDSAMDQLLGRCTSMPVRVIAEGSVVEPNTVYLNPPRVNAGIVAGQFTLSDFELDELRLPINRMFHSVADQYGMSSAAVVLSGTGSDGANGVKSIRRLGGLTIAQSISSAQFDGMPKNAIATDAIDYILSPAETASLLTEYADQPTFHRKNLGPDKFHDTSGVQLIFSLLSESYGINFAHYKPTTVSRRIDRRLKMSRYETLDEFAEVLRESPEQLEFLYHDLLIGVTKFFRDRAAFTALQRELNVLIADLPENETFRVWTVGCASGEEAYSIAILIWTMFSEQGRTPKFKVFATDVHDRILETASRGIYAVDEIDGLSDDLLNEFFTPFGDGQVKVATRLRNHLVFAKQNVVNDPPFTRMDLVTCRNLLIYLQDDAQASAISGFRFALKPDGLMMLGPSETLGKLSPGFDVVDKGWRLYRKNGRIQPSFHRNHTSGVVSARQQQDSTFQLVQLETRSFRMPPLAYQLLSGLLQAALLLDSKQNVLQVFGAAKAYLQQSPDSTPANVKKLFSRDVSHAITALLDQAVNDLGTEFRSRGLNLKFGSQPQCIDISAKAVVGAVGDPPVILLQFFQQDQFENLADAGMSSGSISSGQHAVQLELTSARETLGTTIAKLESSNVELQAANEEMGASNEELQATNEELQSVNEELHTVNMEHQRKVLELEEITDDFNNLFESTRVGSILLDEKLCIRKFTSAAKRYFELMEHDIGRPLFTFASKISIDDFPVKIRKVMSTGVNHLEDAKDSSGEWLSVEIVAYYTGNRISGTIVNIMEYPRKNV